MTTQTLLYNGALRELGERKLSSITEAREARYILDDVYADVLALCLEEGQWNFAMRTIELTYDSSLTLDFGWTYAFSKPSDWVRTSFISADEDFSVPLTDYRDETAYWLANTTPIYLRYVSNDSSYGGLLTRWPATYARYVTLALADRACTRITGAESKKERVASDLRDAKRSALAKDAMNEAQPRRPQAGRWVTSRAGFVSRKNPRSQIG